MTIKQYKAIKLWLDKIEKKISDEMEAEGESPLEILKYMPEILEKVLEAKGINAEEYFRIDKAMDKKGHAKKEAEEEEIDLEATEEDNEEEEEKELEKPAKGWVKKFLASLEK